MNLIILPITVSLLSNNPLSGVVFPEDNEVEDSVQWGQWGDFGSCSAQCGGGKMERHRHCKGPGCRHSTQTQERLCNTQPCHSVQPCSDGEDYCQHPSSYPAFKIAKALEKENSALLRNMLKQGNVTNKPEKPQATSRLRPMKEHDSVIKLRSGLIDFRRTDPVQSRTEPEPEYEKVCQSLTEDIFPRSAKNKNGQYRFIVNGGPEEYVQTVSISKCVGAGLSCNVDSEEETECRQEYIEHKLVSLDQTGQQLEVDTFPLPSGCSCYKQNHFL